MEECSPCYNPGQKGPAMTTLLTALLLLCVAYQYLSLYRLRRARRREVIMFWFCDIRRRLVSLIYKRDLSGAMTTDEYLSARQLLDALNGIIGGYEHQRTRLFNWRAFVRKVLDYEMASGQLEAIELPQNRSLHKLHKEAGLALVLAFFAYTPYLALEIILRLGIRLVKIRFASLVRPLKDAETLGLRLRPFGRPVMPA